MADQRETRDARETREAQRTRDSQRKGFIRLGGLWKNTTADAKQQTYLRGRLGMAIVFVFPQQKKRPDDPDYALFVAADTPPSERARGRRDREPGEDDL